MQHATKGGAPVRIPTIAFTAAAAVIGLAMLVASGTSPAAASSAPAWTITSSPNTSATQNNVLNSVSCTSPTACVAVGDFYNGTHQQTLIETWNGTAWTMTSSPNTSATQNNYLNGVACTSPTACVAVGDFYNGSHQQTLIETWNGTAWTITSSPNTSATQTNYLYGVSCTSPTACVAVGEFQQRHLHSDPDRDVERHRLDHHLEPQHLGHAGQLPHRRVVHLAHRLCGRGRLLQRHPRSDPDRDVERHRLDHHLEPNTSATQDNALNGVSCTSPSACVAVGDTYNGTNYQTLSETWNGTAWTITSSPNTSATQNDDLYGVSCTSPTACVAVGDFSNGH